MNADVVRVSSWRFHPRVMERAPRWRHAVRQHLAAACAGTLVLLCLPTVATAEETTCRGALGARDRRQPARARRRDVHARGHPREGHGQGRDAARRCARAASASSATSRARTRATSRCRGRSRIGGSVQVEQGGKARVSRSRVNGDIQFEQNSGALRAARNRVGGSIQVIGNDALRQDHRQPRRRQPAVQGERARAGRRRERRAGQQGGPVRGALTQ